jgi:hypothetical protein
VSREEGRLVPTADELILAGLKSLPPKDTYEERKGRYSQDMSNVLALALAEAARDRGMNGTRPGGPGALGSSGAERRLAGGIGSKKVDVSWATEESGLIFGGSVKTINWRDASSGNFQKNLTNRRGEMLFESVTLHRRFPFGVLFGLMFLDKDARNDATPRRNSTFENAFPKLRLFTGREDVAGREEQFERFYISLVDANPFMPTVECYRADDPGYVRTFESVLDEAVSIVVERNFDEFEVHAGKLRRLPR